MPGAVQGTIGRAWQGVYGTGLRAGSWHVGTSMCVPLIFYGSKCPLGLMVMSFIAQRVAGRPSPSQASHFYLILAYFRLLGLVPMGFAGGPGTCTSCGQEFQLVLASCLRVDGGDERCHSAATNRIYQTRASSVCTLTGPVTLYW